MSTLRKPSWSNHSTSVYKPATLSKIAPIATTIAMAIVDGETVGLGMPWLAAWVMILLFS